MQGERATGSRDRHALGTDINGVPLQAPHTTADVIKAVTPTGFVLPPPPPNLPNPTFDATTFHTVTRNREYLAALRRLPRVLHADRSFKPWIGLWVALAGTIARSEPRAAPVLRPAASVPASVPAPAAPPRVAAVPPAAAPKPPEPPAHPCAAVFEAARTDLLDAGFQPSTSMHEFFRLDVDDSRITLSVYSVWSPDGDGFRQFKMEAGPARTRRVPWRLTAARVWDEFHEERLPERTWTRATGRWQATSFVRADDTEVERHEREQFETVAKPALDRCLDLVRP